MSSSHAHLALLLTGVMLIGCATANTPTDPTETQQMAEGQCDATPVQQLVGQAATPELLQQAREAAGAKQVRTIKPDDIITMEYDDQRLSLEVDEGGVITRVYCG